MTARTHESHSEAGPTGVVSVGDRFAEELTNALATELDVFCEPAELESLERELDGRGRFRASDRVFNIVRNPSEHDSSSRIVPVNLESQLRQDLMSELVAVSKLEAEIQEMAVEYGSDENLYFDFTLLFYSAALFSRALGGFLEANAERLLEMFPEQDGVLGEFFHHTGAKTSGLHTGGSSIVNGAPVLRYVKLMNVHVTLTEMNSVWNNPFLVWEDAEDAVTSSRYCYNYLRDRGQITDANRGRFLAAVAMSQRAGKLDQQRGATFLLKRYWRELHGQDRAEEVRGVYGLYEKGHGFVFAPNKPHGGTFLNRTLEGPWTGRSSINVRVLTFDRKGLMGFQAKQLARRVYSKATRARVARLQEQRHAVRTLHANVLGYQSGAAMISALHDGRRPRSKSGLLISLRGSPGLISLDALKRHYDHCQAFLDAPRLNDKARAFIRDYYAAKAASDSVDTTSR